MATLREMVGGKSQTSKSYMVMFNMLNRLFGNNWLQKLKTNPRKIIHDIEEFYNNKNTLKSYFSRIIGFLKELKSGGDNVKMSVINEYEKVMLDYNQILNDEREKNIKSNKEASKWISWDKILKLRDKLGSKANTKEKFQDYLILSLFTMLPPSRNDYATFLFKNKFSPKLLNENKNYIVLDKPDNSEFIYNQFKTAKSHGSLQIVIPKKLYNILKEWFTKYNTERKYLLLNARGEPMTRKILSSRVTKIFKNNTGRDLNVNTLRHIFISSFLNNKNISYKQRKQIADLMMHSVNEQLLYTKFD